MSEQPSSFRFELTAVDNGARTGRVTTPRGIIRTPAFMPVGTAATVKALYPDQVRSAGADVVLGNTYHLMLRPGAERVARLGGLHEFMRWSGPILTDSGGFQVMSLAKLRKLTEDGVSFQSHIDGSSHMLTPERSVEIQNLLGSDIQMVLDECPPFPIDERSAAASLDLTHRWAERSLRAFEEYGAAGRAIFGIVQGGVYEHLRAKSVDVLAAMDFPGYSIGGLAVGEGQGLMFDVLEFTTPRMPTGKPRYLMGVGKPDDLVGAVKRGVDMFDCVAPTRSGRHGQAWTKAGPINLKNAAYAEDAAPLDPDSDCPASSEYSKAYLHHLFKAGEYLGPMLLSWHNVAYYQELMAGMRTAIAAGRFEEFEATFHAAREGRR